jgi:hypothetical protein
VWATRPLACLLSGALLIFTVSCGSHGRLSPSQAQKQRSGNAVRPSDSQITLDLEIFRRQQRPSDRLPEALAPKVARYPRELSGGLNVSLLSARLLPSGEYKTWALTNYHNAVCLLHELPVVVRGVSSVGYSFSCEPLGRTIQGWLITTITGGPHAPDGTEVQGLVPDGTSAVFLKERGGRRRQLPVESNSYATVASNPAAIIYYTGRTRHIVPVPDAPVGSHKT